MDRTRRMDERGHRIRHRTPVGRQEGSGTSQGVAHSPQLNVPRGPSPAPRWLLELPALLRISAGPPLYAAARLDCGTRIGPLRAAASRGACAAVQASHQRFCRSERTPGAHDYQALKQPGCPQPAGWTLVKGWVGPGEG
jgi:hypothetical protein